MNEIRKEFEDIKSVLIVKFPFVASILMKARVYASKEVPTACVSEDSCIFVNPDFLSQLSIQEKIFIYAHEAMHLALQSHVRVEEKDPVLFNVAHDVVINELLREVFNVPAHALTADRIERFVNVEAEKIRKMSAEELYRLLEKKAEKIKLSLELRIKDLVKKSSEEIKEKEILQEGDKELYDEQKSKEEIEKLWKEAIESAYQLQKRSGNVPLGLERIVKELLESKVDWRSVLRKSLSNGFGKTIVSTYTKLHRKQPETYPGIKRLTTPSVHVLIDTSGSIDDKKLAQFVSEVYAIAKNARVCVTCFDTEAYETIKAKSQSEVVQVVAKKLKGGGGTEIRKALEKTLETMKSQDVVVVLTDGHIFDLNNLRTQELFAEIAKKASTCVIASTDALIKIPKWKLIKIW